ncbi:unnamed protein product [Rotaria sordida]|nr:unnamed protein product [Rotaria sordida]
MPYVAQVAVGRLLHMNVTGTDHDTPDGTDIRDYIHVVDMTTGHIACMKKFKENCSLQTCIQNFFRFYLFIYFSCIDL